MAVKEWKNHKYIRKEGNRYIYPSDLHKSTRNTSRGKLVGHVTDIYGNKVQVRGGQATNAIASRSKRYDPASGERMSASEYNTRVKDGSLERMHGQVVQEAAKKQGEYSRQMMRQEKAAQATTQSSTPKSKGTVGKTTVVKVQTSKASDDTKEKDSTSTEESKDTTKNSSSKKKSSTKVAKASSNKSSSNTGNVNNVVVGGKNAKGVTNYSGPTKASHIKKGHASVAKFSNKAFNRKTSLNAAAKSTNEFRKKVLRLLQS